MLLICLALENLIAGLLRETRLSNKPILITKDDFFWLMTAAQSKCVWVVGKLVIVIGSRDRLDAITVYLYLCARPSIRLTFPCHEHTMFKAFLQNRSCAAWAVYVMYFLVTIWTRSLEETLPPEKRWSLAVCNWNILIKGTILYFKYNLYFTVMNNNLKQPRPEYKSNKCEVSGRYFIMAVCWHILTGLWL